MLIENVDSLKQWLVQKLAPICDAEPTALAKYVCALVRKDKPESELREICSDQLDVFLQQKTKPFVDDLFIGLKTKEYESVVVKPVSTTSTPTPTPVVTPIPTPVKVEVKTEPAVPSPSRTASQSASASSTQSKVSSAEPSHKRVKKSEESSQSQSWTSVPVKPEAPPDGRESREGRDAREGRDPRDRDGREDREPRERRDSDRREGDRRDNRDVRDRRRRTRSRSFSPRRRDIDERRRRYDERDRGRYSPERRFSPDRRYRRRTRSRSPRRYRISPERRGRSRSPRERDLRDKLNRRSRSWSRPRSRSRSRGRVEPDSRGSTPTQDNGHYPAVVTSNPSLPSLVSISHKPLEPPPPGEGPPLIMPGPGGPPGSGPPPGQPRLRGQNMRCQSFDEKGFCMLGDLCPYDHGMDPVVVEDIGIPNVLSFPPPPTGHPLPPPPVSLSVPPPRPGFPPPGMNVPPPGALIRPPGPPRPPRPPVEPYQPEGYNPEAPGLTPSSTRTPFWASHPPPGVPPGAFPLPPDAMNVPPPQRQRDLVTVHTLMGKDEDQDTDSRSSPPTVASRVVMPSKRTHTEMEGGPMRMTEGGPMRMTEGGPMRMTEGGPMRMEGGPMRMMDGGPMRMMEGGPMRMMEGGPMRMMEGGPMRIVQRPHFNPRHGFGGPRKHFDFKRLGGFQRQQLKQTNTTLEVRKIPPEMNNIAKLNEHFGKFGTLTNIHVKFEGDPGAALISYSRNDEAASAYHSSEPVFNNRFIKLFWHRPGANQAPNSGPGFNPAANATGDGGAGGGGGMEKAKTEGEAGHSGILNRLGPFNQPTNDMAISEYDPEESSTEAVSSTSQDANSKPQSVVRQTVIPPAHKLSLNNMTKAGPRTPADQSIVYTTSLGHLRKTVFNQQVAKARAAVAPKFSPTAVGSADFVSRIEAIKKNEELKKEAIVKKAELEKKKQVLLEQQVAQQKLLLDKLERGKTTLTLEEKTNIMKMLKVVSDSIDKLKFKSGTPITKKLPPAGSHKLVNTPTPSPTVAATTSTSPAVTVVQQTVKRDILDTELDLMTKQGTGEDTSVLRHRLVELTQQAASMGLLGRGRGLARGRGSGPWWQGGRGRGGGSMTLDKRPKTLEVRGFLLEDLDEVKAHFALFGEIVQTELKEDIPCVILTFANRKQAESAYAAGARFKKRALSVRWHMGQVHLITEADISAAIPSDQTDDADTEEDELQVTIGGETEETMDGPATSLDEVPGELDEVPDTLDEVPDTLDEAAINPDEEVDDVLVSLDEDMDERILLAPDEEEDDDADNRSWRR